MVDSWFSVMGGVWSILGFRQWIVGSRLWAADFGYWVPILAVDGWFLIIGFGFVCGYACGWDMILWVGELIWVLGFCGGCVVSGFWVVKVLKVFRRGLPAWVCWSKNPWVDGCRGFCS